MKEQPIIFSGEMVKAILADTKMQTRRVINPQPRESPLVDAYEWWHWKDKGGVGYDKYCPYGQVGGRLWVRETWRVESFMEGEPMLFGYKDGKTAEEQFNDDLGYESWYERVCIQSTEDAAKAFEQGLVRQNESGFYLWDIGKSPCRWRPSIFMPRWASRILLEITEVRVERLQDITESDAEAEGCSWVPQGTQPNYEELPARYDFAQLWDSLNVKRGYGWGANPWVWVISFEVAKKGQ